VSGGPQRKELDREDEVEADVGKSEALNMVFKRAKQLDTRQDDWFCRMKTFAGSTASLNKQTRATTSSAHHLLHMPNRTGASS
jgi:hypothetical protein